MILLMSIAILMIMVVMMMMMMMMSFAYSVQQNVLFFAVTCWGKPNGNYKDPGNCYGYISCSNQIAYYMPCPAGLKYNEVHDKCDWPKNVNCY